MSTVKHFLIITWTGDILAHVGEGGRDGGSAAQHLGRLAASLLSLMQLDRCARFAETMESNSCLALASQPVSVILCG